MAKKSTYKIHMHCSNCEQSNLVEIPRGETCGGMHECPNCGCQTASKPLKLNLPETIPVPVPYPVPVPRIPFIEERTWLSDRAVDSTGTPSIETSRVTCNDVKPNLRQLRAEWD